MQLTRYLKPAQIKLELDAAPPVPVPEEWSHDRLVWHVKERVLDELIELFVASKKVANATKLRTDLINREKKSSTAVGQGVAIPHVRTMQAREFTICIARSTAGIDFDAPDGALVHVFFGVVAPPYGDKLYLEVYREIGEMLTHDATRAEIMEASSPHEVIKAVMHATR